MSAIPPAKDYLEWVRMFVAVFIIMVGVGIIIWFMWSNPKVLIDRSELFIGWFLGILSGSAIYIGIMQRTPKP